MEITRETMVANNITVGITCDVCGASCRDHMDMNYEFVSLRGSWGYCSGRDGTSWECHICEPCAVKIKQFIESLGGEIIVTNYI